MRVPTALSSAVLLLNAIILTSAAQAAPIISADPAEVHFYNKNSTLQKSSTINWDADLTGIGAGDPTVAVHYTVNGANEAQFATGEKGMKVANFIKVNNKYEFCIWAKSHTQKLACTTVTTKVIEVKFNFGFIRNVEVTPRGHSVQIKFTTDRQALAIVQIGSKQPKKFPVFSKQDIPAFDPGDIVSASLPSINTTHSLVLPN